MTKMKQNHFKFEFLRVDPVTNAMLLLKGFHTQTRVIFIQTVFFNMRHLKDF